jgi:hypothetical protein
MTFLGIEPVTFRLVALLNIIIKVDSEEWGNDSIGKLYCRLGSD